MKTELYWHPTQTKAVSENHASLPHKALSKILGTQTQQGIKRLIYDQVTVIAGMQGRFNMWKINWHKWPKNRNRKTHNDIYGCWKSVLTNFNVSIRRGRVPGPGPRPLTPYFGCKWLGQGWGRIWGRAFWLPKAST